MSPAVVAFTDFTAPLSYVAEIALARAARGRDVTVQYRALERFPAPEPLGEAAGVRGDAEEAAMAAEELGIELALPAVLPRTRKAHEAARFARDRGAEAPMREAIHAALWRDGRDIGRIDVLVEIGEGVGLPPDELKIALDIDRYAGAVLGDRAVAGRLGIDRVPSLVVSTGTESPVLVTGPDFQGALAQLLGAR